MRHDSSGRVEGLDALRGLAALLVCWFHLTAFNFPTPPGDFYKLLRSSAQYGWVGVEIFFVISGLVIPYALLRAGYRVRDYPQFIIKRLVRLDPPYLASIGLIIAVFYWHARHTGTPFLIEGAPVTWGRVLLHLGYLNVFFESSWLNPVFWTLAVEFQYYLIVGLIFPVLASPSRKLRLTALACLSLPCLLFADPPPPGGLPGGGFILKFTCLFLMGAVTFQYMAGIIGRAEYLTLLLLFICGSVLTVGPVAALGGAGAAAGAVLYRRGGRAGDFFGRVSYSLYLLHWLVGPVVLSLVASKLIDTSADSGKALALLCSLAACVASAWLLYATVERPAQRLSSRIKYRRP